MRIPCTGVILSGGKNKRFRGYNKAYSKVGSLRIVDRTYKIFKKIFEDVIIVTNTPLTYTNFDSQIVTDHYLIRSSLNGIHAGLFSSQTEYSFFVACDAPFINPNLVTFIINQINPNKDVIIPETSLGFEPLFAVYSKKCLNPMEKQIERGDFKIRNLFKNVCIKKLKEIELKKHDPNLMSFFNVNCPDDLLKADIYQKTLTKVL